MRVAKIASIAESQGITVIIALVSPKAKWRIEARKLLKESKLIYLSGGTLWAGTEYEEPMEEEFG
jgi:adenylylsulfate kinase-like enzyme